uniref:CEP295 N-terminal like n=1 Tax=Molossus molossus TaxID=27622 RepID=A0A7J8CWR4_MOLMO|nr:CEP295 N-terminal like [Molossus molossus]
MCSRWASSVIWRHAHGVCPPAPSGLTWNCRGIRGSSAPRARSSAPGSHQLPSDAMSAKVSSMKRHPERAARRSPHPHDEGLLLRQKHSLLQARESGDLATRRRPGPGPQNGRQPWHWAEASRAGWQEAPSQHVRAQQRLRLAHLLGVGRGWAKQHEPYSEGPAWRPRARKTRGRAARGEKRCREDLGRLQPRRAKSRRTVVGTERKGASQGMGLPRLPPGPPEKSKGKRGPSRKTGGGCRPPDPRARGGPDAVGLWTAAEGLTLLGQGEKDTAQGGRRRPGRTAHLVPGLKNNCLGQSPKSKVDSLEQLRSISPTSGGEASSQAAPCQPRAKSRWQRELESVFEALFTVNRRLKRELSLHLPPRQGGLSELQGLRGDTLREKPAVDAEMELVPAGGAMSAVQADACHSSSPRTNLQKLLGPLEDQPGRRMAEPQLKDEGSLSCSEAGTLISEESPHWYGADSRHELPRLDMLSLRLRLQEQADRAGSAPSRLKQSVERRRLTPLEPPEPPEGSLEALSQTLSQTLSRAERGDERRERMRAYSAPSKVPSWEQGKEGGYASRPASPQGASGSDDDDYSDHSQMISDLEKQILQQNKLHKQFLEEARKRLQEFQRVC